MNSLMRMVTDRLCTSDPEWENRELVDEAVIWKDTGILKATGRYNCVRCTCGETHTAEVEDGRRRDGSYGPIAHCCYTGHAFPVEPEDLISYTFDPNRMLEILSELLRCREEPVEVIPDRLWKMGKSGVAIGGRSRDVYFATRMTQRNTQETYDRLPDSKTPLLVVGSSHMIPDWHGRYDDNRVIMLESILIPQNGKWTLDLEWLNTLANDALEEEPVPETRDATGATVEAIQKALHLYLEAAFRNYCEQIRKGNGAQMPKPALTLTALAKMVQKDKSRVSRLLELRKPLEQCSHAEIRIQWESTQDITMMVQYGKKYWGRKYRGWE